MPNAINRRDWLKFNSLATLALGFSLPSIANEEGIPRNFGAEQGLINLGSNENPYGISPKAKDAISRMIVESNRYQFNVASLQHFRDELSKYYQVSSDQVIVTPGSGNALQLLGLYFSKGNIVTATPTFGIFPRSVKNNGGRLIEIPLTSDKVHDLPAMLRAINKETQAVYICNPANPSSTIVPSRSLKNFCMEAAKKTVVIIDEAYIDFLIPPDNESMMALVEKTPNLIVLRTFSKIHAMAGLRVGFLVAHPTMIAKLEENYFTNAQIGVSNLSMAAAAASMNDEAHRISCKHKNAAARDYTIASLKEMKISAIPSFTNFIFFPLGKYPGDFAKNMLQKNVIVRSDNYPDGKWARVSIGTIDEMKKFISLMKAEWRS
jgi:histidinol-phosphate aminotransferase